MNYSGILLNNHEATVNMSTVETRDSVIADFLRLHGAAFDRRSLAGYFNVSVRTISRVKRELGLTRHHTVVSDDELQALLHELRDHGPASRYGITMTRGALQAAGITVPRRQVARVLALVDPVGMRLRRRTAIVRRSYVNPGPNAMWHMDAYHKLVR